jgi:hypothetical protein
MPYDICEHNGVWVVMFTADGIYKKPWNAFFECNSRNFALARRGTNKITEARFKVGQNVRVARMIVVPGNYNEEQTAQYYSQIGFVGLVEEVEDLPNGEYNYQVGDAYLNEYMLEPAPKPKPKRVFTQQQVVGRSRDVDLEHEEEEERE